MRCTLEDFVTQYQTEWLVTTWAKQNTNEQRTSMPHSLVHKDFRLPQWLNVCIVKPEYLVSIVNVNMIILRENSTHQPFLLDSSWTFTCHPRSQKHITSGWEDLWSNLLRNFIDSLILLYSYSLTFFLSFFLMAAISTYLPLPARGPPVA